MCVIGGTWYGGEMKRNLLSYEYYLPLRGIASMHCSANVGRKGDVAIFFGLSGTGKTTLSTDPKRALIEMMNMVGMMMEYLILREAATLNALTSARRMNLIFLMHKKRCSS